MINGGLAFAVPGLITGLELGTALGFEQSLYAFLVGGLLLSVLGFVTGLVGMHNRFASCMTMKFVFGRYGSNLISLLFVVALLGWYGVNIDLFSDVSQQLSLRLFDASPSIMTLEIILGVVITLTTIWGFKLIEKVANLFVPLLALVVVYMLVQSLNFQADGAVAAPVQHSLGFGEAVSIVVGSFIVSVVLMPDFTRFAKNTRDTAVASFLPFLGLSSFVYIASALAGLAVSDSDVLTVMLTLGLGGVAFFLLIVSSWVTNVVNLYSVGLGLNAINTRLREWKIIVVAGVLGTLFASFNLLDRFTDFLFGLSVVFTPVAAIYVVDFFVIRKQRRYQLDELHQSPAMNWPALMAWGLGIGASLLSNQGHIWLTGIEACDALLVTTPAYWLLRQIMPSPAFKHPT
ncbi:cytosine permease [Neiella marina]|uniref:Cytosine permease n=2 Tax=Neiella holothuriorum TaxID=2870530 RepID=A0ABS7EBZ7_9GAMM|nr:cytosine permease [Neiella holothuriorum]